MTARALMSRPEMGGDGDMYDERMLPCIIHTMHG